MQEKSSPNSPQQERFTDNSLPLIKNIGREIAGERGDISHIDKQEGEMNNGVCGGVFNLDRDEVRNNQA